jgi:mono/diheme cytochrome c family protein
MRKFLIALCLLGALGLVVFWVLTKPRVIAGDELPVDGGDPARGEYIFYASGCASCHAAPGAKGDEKLKLAGGLGLKTPFGTFYAPNISSDKTHGIGGWSTAQFVNAVMRGVSPDGSHYYPAFPYMSYQRMKIGDVVDLKAFMDTLPAVASDAPPHDLPLPLRLRRGLGLWKSLFMDYEPFVPNPDADSQVNRGAYLVNGPSHCGECHTPRDIIGGPENAWAFSGGPEPDSKDFYPNITPHEQGIGDWSSRDIVSALRTGILPDFDTFGGSMIPVQENMAKLTTEDLEAIAAYLKSLPPKPSRWKIVKTKDP